MKNNRFGTIFEIGDCLVSEEVITEYFACDYEKCKGCCCIIGDSGAPMKEEEIEKIEEAYPVFFSAHAGDRTEGNRRKGLLQH